MAKSKHNTTGNGTHKERASKAKSKTPRNEAKAKRKEERRLEIKKEIQAKIQARIQRRKELQVPAPVDAEFMELLALLNKEDSYEPITLKGKLHFDQSVWESDFRGSLFAL